MSLQKLDIRNSPKSSELLRHALFLVRDLAEINLVYDYMRCPYNMQAVPAVSLGIGDFKFYFCEDENAELVMQFQTTIHVMQKEDLDGIIPHAIESQKKQKEQKVEITKLAMAGSN